LVEKGVGHTCIDSNASSVEFLTWAFDVYGVKSIKIRE